MLAQAEERKSSDSLEHVCGRSYPENRSRGQYRLRFFHFPVATWTHKNTQTGRSR